MIIQRIKDFFKKIFSKTKYLESPKDNYVEINLEGFNKKNANNFFENVKLNNEEENRILEIQKKFKKGEIQLQDISKEDKDKLATLYISQIKKQIKEISDYQTKITNAIDDGVV